MSRLESLAERITTTLFLLLAVGGVLLVATPRRAGAAANCKPQRAACKTNQNCCSGVCTANVCAAPTTTTNTTTTSTTTTTPTPTTTTSTSTTTTTTTTMSTTTTTTVATTTTTTSTTSTAAPTTTTTVTTTTTTTSTTTTTLRFVDNGDGTVTDRHTGLQWEKKDGAGGGPNFTNPHDVDNVYTWSSSGTAPDGTAFTDFLATLNGGVTGVGNCTSADGNMQTGGFAGHCDWRVPTVVELETILLAPSPCATSPCIDPIFGPTAPDFYWSSTTIATSAGEAWIVDFSDGTVGSDPKSDVTLVRAVRGGS